MGKLLRLPKMYLKTVLSGIFPGKYIRVKNNSVVLKHYWYSLKKVVLSPRELTDKILPHIFMFEDKSKSKISIASKVQKCATIEEKVELLYNYYISKFNNKSFLTTSETMFNNLFQKNNFGVHASTSKPIPIWQQLLGIFKITHPKKPKLELLPSTSIVSKQEAIIEEKQQLMKNHRYGKIKISADKLVDDPILIQETKVIDNNNVIISTIVTN